MYYYFFLQVFREASSVNAYPYRNALFLAGIYNRFKDEDRSVTFFSDRKSVTLRRSEIAYIESNDTEVRVVSASGESYRNKTGISQWEHLLGSDFLRIHRSYLINLSVSTLASPDTVNVGGVLLPVSRKYKDAVRRYLGDSGSSPE